MFPRLFMMHILGYNAIIVFCMIDYTAHTLTFHCIYNSYKSIKVLQFDVAIL